MDTRRCETCAFGVPVNALLCEACADAQGRCPNCGADHVYDPANCSRCHPKTGAEAPRASARTRRRSGAAAKPLLPLTGGLMALCVLGTLGYWAVAARGEEAIHALSRYGFVPPCQAFDGSRPWGLLLDIFPHVDLLHLIMNLSWLWPLGSALERSVKPLRMLLFVAAAAWISGGSQLLVSDAGLGMSGVLYALVGFGWLTRGQYPALAAELTPSVMKLFLGWMVFCIVATALGLLNVGNGAHVGGLLFGLAVGALVRCPRTFPVAPLAAATAVLVLAATLPLYWAPWSASRRAYEGHRTAELGYQAAVRGDYDSAIRYYRQSLDHGVDPKWAWRALAEAYGYRSRPTEYREAVLQLRKLDPAAATEVEGAYGAASP